MQEFYRILPWAGMILGMLGIGFLLVPPGGRPVQMRLPDKRLAEIRSRVKSATAGVVGRVTQGPGKPSRDLGRWDQFRGPERTGALPDAAGLFRKWPENGPVVLWETSLGEGHAGAAVRRGRVYLLDYDREREEDAFRCLSLADGREIWRFSYPVRVKRNHGMSRTVPAVTDKFAVALGPKCLVYCVDAESGQSVWVKDLVAECGTRVPPWYAGQCPLVDGDAAILAPGADPLLMAVELSSGRVLWKTPNPGGWGMTHSSVCVFEHPAGRQYVYAATRGLVGVSAKDGKLLWKYPAWRIKIANIPTPVPVGRTRLFLSGGYNAGAALVEVSEQNGEFTCREIRRWNASEFGSAQQTPILRSGYIYGVVPNPHGALACLDLTDGKVRWVSDKDVRLELGPYLLAGDLVYALNDQSGTLFLGRVSPAGFEVLDRAKVLEGHDAWAPMALVGGRLLLRDLTQLRCLEVGDPAAAP
ncbi:MAG: PQQ-binding-like beta-propeller repeat protein [Kiritimatiellaeota bacterium]|nr:PQQ-binding-like beta-propeller repeat protein [Kiritimatiellota bacterium]